jgi:hypothetical protein
MTVIDKAFSEQRSKSEIYRGCVHYLASNDPRRVAASVNWRRCSFTNALDTRMKRNTVMSFITARNSLTTSRPQSTITIHFSMRFLCSLSKMRGPTKSRTNFTAKVFSLPLGR